MATDPRKNKAAGSSSGTGSTGGPRPKGGLDKLKSLFFTGGEASAGSEVPFDPAQTIVPSYLGGSAPQPAATGSNPQPYVPEISERREPTPADLVSVTGGKYSEEVYQAAIIRAEEAERELVGARTALELGQKKAEKLDDRVKRLIEENNGLQSQVDGHGEAVQDAIRPYLEKTAGLQDALMAFREERIDNMLYMHRFIGKISKDTRVGQLKGREPNDFVQLITDYVSLDRFLRSYNPNQEEKDRENKAVAEYILQKYENWFKALSREGKIVTADSTINALGEIGIPAAKEQASEGVVIDIDVGPREYTLPKLGEDIEAVLSKGRKINPELRGLHAAAFETLYEPLLMKIFGNAYDRNATLAELCDKFVPKEKYDNDIATQNARTERVRRASQEVIASLKDENAFAYAAIKTARDETRENLLREILGEHYRPGLKLADMLNAYIAAEFKPLAERYAEENAGLRRDVAERDERLAAYKDIMPEQALQFQADLESLTARLAAAEEIALDSAGKIDTQAEYDVIEARAKAALQVRDEAVARVKELEGQAHPDYDDVVIARNKAESALRAAQEEASYAQKQVAAKDEELGRYKKAAEAQADRFRDDIGKLNTEKSDLEEKLGKAIEEMRTLGDKLNSAGRKISELRRSKAEDAQELAQLREDLGKTTANYQATSRIVTDLEKRIGILQGEKDDTVAQEEKAQAQLLTRFTVDEVWQTFSSYATRLVDAGRYDDAIGFYQAVLAKDNDNAGARFGLGRALKAKELANAKVIDDTVLQSLDAADTYKIKELLPVLAIAHRTEYVRLLLAGNTEAVAQYKANAAKLDPVKGTDDYLWKPFDEVAIAQIRDGKNPEDANREYLGLVGRVLACGDRFLRGITTSKKRGFTTRDLLSEYLVEGGEQARADMTTYRDAFKINRGGK